jgi:L-iditol 2-dehydrogenase
MIAELTALRTFRLGEQTIEAPAPGEVQVKVEAVGVCGSDLHQFAEGHVGNIFARYPMVLGHEPTGTILALGEGVTGWAPGDRVAMEVPIFCYHCRYCMSGLHNLCENVRFMSSPTEPGFFRDRVNLPARNLLGLPANLDFAEGALHEPLAIILHSFAFGQPKIGETAVVIGGGPIGLTTLAGLRLNGLKRIWVIEPVAHRRQMALELGADAVLDPREVDVVKEIWNDSRGGADLVFDCATREDTMNQALRMARPAGRVVITGVPSEQRPEIEFHQIRTKELGFFTVRRCNHEAPDAMELLAAHPGAFAPMITHRRPLTAIQATFETLDKYEDGIGKAILRPAVD